MCEVAFHRVTGIEAVASAADKHCNYIDLRIHNANGRFDVVLFTDGNSTLTRQLAAAFTLASTVPETGRAIGETRVHGVSTVTVPDTSIPKLVRLKIVGREPTDIDVFCEDPVICERLRTAVLLAVPQPEPAADNVVSMTA